MSERGQEGFGRHFLGRELSRVSTRWTSLDVSLENSQPLGKYWRIRPLVV